MCVCVCFLHPGFAAATGRAHFGAGDGRIVLDDVRCVGNESRLLNCRAAEKGVHNCAPSEDAGVYCPCEYITV